LCPSRRVDFRQMPSPFTVPPSPPHRCSQFVCQPARDQARLLGSRNSSIGRVALFIKAGKSPGVSFVPFRSGTGRSARGGSAQSRPECTKRRPRNARPAAGGRFPRIQSSAVRARTPRVARAARGGSVCRVACPFVELITPAAQLSARLWVALPAIKLAARKLRPDRRDYSVGAITRVECARDCFPYVEIRDLSSRGWRGWRGGRIRILAECRRETIAASSRSNR